MSLPSACVLSDSVPTQSRPAYTQTSSDLCLRSRIPLTITVISINQCPIIILSRTPDATTGLPPRQTRWPRGRFRTGHVDGRLAWAVEFTGWPEGKARRPRLSRGTPRPIHRWSGPPYGFHQDREERFGCSRIDGAIYTLTSPVARSTSPVFGNTGKLVHGLKESSANAGVGVATGCEIP